ncbi:hypothetical protein BLNAU_12101 [Blattamonas nauphoetae]|uniref:Uncharacterized protein n=1 Tax=Blattamonas nauphoetae TaxID=2049346 RepID=A0ABQ9XN51_9EUKA|nr:hypothetical protein BLNAU_12101 [Blattamonas nauphoetae]
MDNAQAPLTINQCFFHKCSTSSSGNGGAINVQYNSNNQHQVTVGNSSFTECSTPLMNGGFGGGMCIVSPESLTVNRSFFEKCSSENAGAVYISTTTAYLSNTSFVSCNSTGFGGALTAHSITEMFFTKLQFRGCKSDNKPNSKDIFFDDTSDTIANSNSVTFCDSTSGSPNVFFQTDAVADSTLVPQLDSDKTVYISSMEVKIDGAANITIRTTIELSSYMSVLLEGLNVPRLLFVKFQGADNGVAYANIGDKQIFPALTDGQSLTPRSASIPGFSLIFNATIQVFEAILEFTDDTCSSLVLKVIGKNLPVSSSNYTVKIVKSSQTFKVKFISGSEGQSEPISITTPLTLEYGKEYSILSIEEDDSSNPQRVFCHTVNFTVPTPSHLTSARLECTTSLCTSVSFVFEGQELVPGVTFVTKIQSTAFSFTTTFSSSTSGESEPIEVSPTNPLPLDGFKIESMEEKDASPARVVNVNKIPKIIPQKEIIGVTCTLDHTATAYTITFNTVFVVSSSLGVTLKDELNETPTIYATLKDGILTATKVIPSDPPNNMLPGRTYTVVGTNGLNISIRPSLSFTAPILPKVLSAETECANKNCSTMNIVLSGQAFITDRTFLLSLDGITAPIQFSCETQTSATLGPLQIGTGFDFTHSTTYTLLSIIEDTITDPYHILCDGVTFTTPPIPRLSTVHASSGTGDDGLNCGEESDPCKTMEHALGRLNNGKSTLLLQGSFNHVSVWEISFSSLVISHNRVLNDVGSAVTHSTIRVGKDGGLVVDGATETRLESLSFVLHPFPTVEVYAEIKTGLLTIMNCLVTGDVSTSSSLSARHPSFVRTRNVIDLVRLTTTQLEHPSVATLLTRLSVGLTQILKWEAESVRSQSTAGSAAFFTLSNTSSLDLSSSSFTSCSSSNANCLGGGVSFSLSGSASLVIQYCSFVSCSVGDGGRGGGVGLAFSSDSSNNYLLNTVTFAHNTATFGRDLFVVAESLEKTVAIDHFLFNLHPPGFDRSNALFGSDRVAYVEETDLFPFLFPNNRFKNVFVDSLGASGDASNGAECGRESLPCQSLHDAMDHLLNADSEEELSESVLERTLVLIGDLVFGEMGDVELCGYVSVGHQAGLVLSIIPIRTHKRTQTDPVEYGKVRFTESGSIGCKLTFGLSEVVPAQTVLMKHLEFVLPLFSTHPQSIIAVQSVSLSLIDCVVTSIDSTQPISSLLSFHSSLTSMAESVRLSVSRLVAQNIILSQPLISIKSSADLPLLIDSLSTGHSNTLSQTLPFSLPPSLSIEDSHFDRISLKIDATHAEPIETGSVLFADLSLPLSKLLIRDCSFSSCSTVIISVPVESDLLSSFASGVCCFSLARSHLTLIDSSFVNCSFLLDPSYVVPPSPSLLAFASNTLAVRFLPSQQITTLASPLSAASVDSPLMATILSANLANPSFLFDNSLIHSPLSSHLEFTGVEMEAGSSLDPLRPLPLALFVSNHSTPSLSTRNCVFRFDTADPLNVGLAVVRVCSGAWPVQRNMLFVNCTSSRREESKI